jgi:hypothetical protein
MSDDKQRVKCAHDDCVNTFALVPGAYLDALGKHYCSQKCQQRALDAWFDAARERAQASVKQAELFGNG